MLILHSCLQLHPTDQENGNRNRRWRLSEESKKTIKRYDMVCSHNIRSLWPWDCNEILCFWSSKSLFIVKLDDQDRVFLPDSCLDSSDTLYVWLRPRWFFNWSDSDSSRYCSKSPPSCCSSQWDGDLAQLHQDFVSPAKTFLAFFSHVVLTLPNLRKCWPWSVRRND